MAVYVVGRVNTKDFSWLKEYGAGAKALIEKHGGRYIAQGGAIESLEGSEPLPTAMVMLEFPDAASVHAWHDDPDYQPLIELRQAHAQTELTLVEGL